MTQQNLFDGHALPVPAWPDLDRYAWAKAQSGDDDLLAKRSPAASWRPSTMELHCRNYGIWLAWLKSERLLNPDVHPGERVTRLAAYLRAERAFGNGARTLVNHAVSLRHMFEALAPQQDWGWMLPIIRKLQTAVKPTKNHSDLPSIRELFDVGLAIMYKASEPDHGSPKQHGSGSAMASLSPCSPRGH